jgi:hypothetical protein
VTQHANWTVNQPIAARMDCRRTSGSGSSIVTDMGVSVASLVPSAPLQSIKWSIAQYCRQYESFSFKGPSSSFNSRPWKSRLLSILYRRSSAIDGSIESVTGDKIYQVTFTFCIDPLSTIHSRVPTTWSWRGPFVCVARSLTVGSTVTRAAMKYHFTFDNQQLTTQLCTFCFHFTIWLCSCTLYIMVPGTRVIPCQSQCPTAHNTSKSYLNNVRSGRSTPQLDAPWPRERASAVRPYEVRNRH